MRVFTFLLLLFPAFQSFTQDHIITGIIDGLPEGTVYLADFYGDQNHVIDSARSDVSGSFEMSLSGLDPGFYRLIFEQQKRIDFIYNQESVSFTSNVLNPLENLVFAVSIENLLWYDYLFRKEECQFKLELLNPLLIYYPKSTDFHTSLTDEYSSVQIDFEDYVSSVMDLNTMTFAAKAIKIDKPYLVNIEIPLQEQNNFIKAHYFDGIVLDDPSLLRSNIISSKIIGYLSLYRDPAFSKEEQEKEFIQAIDSILIRVMDDEEIYNFTLQYLIDGFELYGFDKVITHIAEHYNPAETCVRTGEKSELIKRMENIKKLAVGQQVPDINIIDNNGNPFILSEANSKYTLIIFWASWCGHCKNIMPELSGIYKDQEDNSLEIIAISVDTSHVAFEAVVKEEHFPWINYFDPLGWDSQPAKDYSIYATPSMFLLDEKRTILAKPMDLNELKGVLADLP